MSSLSSARKFDDGAVPPPAAKTTRARRKRAWRAELSSTTGLLLSAPFIAFAMLFIVYPFVRLVLLSVTNPLGLDHYANFLDDGAHMRALATTFIGAAIVSAIAVSLGSLAAWALRTTESRPLRLLILAAVFIPFWMGSVTKIYAFTVLLERLGIVNRLLMALQLTETPLGLIYNPFAVVVGMAYQMLPYAVLPLYVAFLSIDLDLVRAAESLGASRLRALLGIVIPQALPGLLATATIVYVISLGFYLTPVLLGGSTNPFTASLISADIFYYYDLANAAVSSMILLIGAIVVVVLGTMVVGRRRLMRALG